MIMIITGIFDSIQEQAVPPHSQERGGQYEKKKKEKKEKKEMNIRHLHLDDFFYL